MPKNLKLIALALVARASILVIIFAVASVALAKLFSLVPDFGKLSPWVTLGLPLALAWLVTAGLGANIAKKKHALVFATICLLVAAPLAYLKPWERGGGWQPGQGEVPENIPEGCTAFRFISSFTYVSSEGNQPITDVELQLPWPYVDAYENGRPLPKPVGLDNWLQKTDVLIDLQNPGRPEMREWLWNVWKLENVQPENAPGFENYYRLENAVWSAESFSLPGMPYTLVSFNPELKLYYGDQLEWKDNRVIGLLGGRTTEPTITAHLEAWAHPTIFQKVTVKLSDMRPGETISIEGTFLVAEGNASKVRLDDWIESGMWRTFTPDQENVPIVSWNFNSNIQIGERFLSTLQKQVGTDFVDVVGQQFGRKSTVGYVTPHGFGPLTILD